MTKLSINIKPRTCFARITAKATSSRNRNTINKKKMYTLGLTGSIGMGKTTVSNMFRESGVPVICADQVIHERDG